MARGSKEVGAVDGVAHLEAFAHELDMLVWRDGHKDDQEATVVDLFARIVTAFQEWVNRFLVLLSNVRGFESPPGRTAILADDHITTYGVNPLEQAA